MGETLVDFIASVRRQINAQSASTRAYLSGRFRVGSTAPSDRLPSSSTPPPAQRAAHGGPDDRKGSSLNDLPRVKRAGQAIRGGDE